jgi:hypothetical protein
MTRPDLPPELLALVHAIEACEREAQALVSDVSEDELNWQPEPGKSWSIGQCLDHLTKINSMYVPGFLDRIQRARGKVGPFNGLTSTAGGRWFIRQQEPPVKLRVKTVASVVPRSNVSLNGLVEGFKRSHDSYRALVDAAADVDVNRVKGPNPFFPFIPMRVSTVLQVVPGHDRRHLWQANNVKRALRSKAKP